MRKKILAIFALLVLVLSCSKLEEYGELTSVEYTFTKAISNINVSSGCELILDDAIDSNVYIVVAYESIHPYIKKEVTSEGINIFIDKSNRDDDLYLKVTASSRTFNSISAEEGSKVTVDNLVTNHKNYSVKLSGGSYFNGTIESDSMLLHSQGGSITIVAGRSSLLEISECTGGSIIDSEYLYTDKVLISLSGGSRASVSAKDSLIGSCSGGSILNYKCDSTTIINVESLGGSTIEKI